MSSHRVKFGKPFVWTFFIYFFVVVFSLPTAALAGDCDPARSVDLNTNLRSSGLHGAEIFEIYVPSSGIMAVEATVPVDAATRPKLALLDDACRPVTAGPGAIERFVSGTVMEISAAGTYRFVVAPQNPVASLETYGIVTRFVSWADLCSRAALKTLVEPEPEPDLGAICRSKTLVEPEPEPDLGKTLVEPEPEPDLLALAVKSLCARGESDGHSGAFACARRIDLDAIHSGRFSTIRSSDAFRFTLERQTTVVIEVTTLDDVSLGAYDVHGHSLDLEDLDPETAHLYVVTLASGAYHLRLDVPGGAEAGFELSVRDAGW